MNILNNFRLYIFLIFYLSFSGYLHAQYNLKNNKEIIYDSIYKVNLLHLDSFIFYGNTLRFPIQYFNTLPPYSKRKIKRDIELIETCQFIDTIGYESYSKLFKSLTTRGFKLTYIENISDTVYRDFKVEVSNGGYLNFRFEGCIKNFELILYDNFSPDAGLEYYNPPEFVSTYFNPNYIRDLLPYFRRKFILKNESWIAFEKSVNNQECNGKNQEWQK